MAGPLSEAAVRVHRSPATRGAAFGSAGSPARRAGELMTLQGAIRVRMVGIAEAPEGGLPWGCRLLGSERGRPCRNVCRNSGSAW